MVAYILLHSRRDSKLLACIFKNEILSNVNIFLCVCIYRNNNSNSVCYNLFKETSCYGLNVCVSPNSYVETLNPNVTVFGDTACEG